jgi:hypothetical protein
MPAALCDKDGKINEATFEAIMREQVRKNSLSVKSRLIMAWIDILLIFLYNMRHTCVHGPAYFQFVCCLFAHGCSPWTLGEEA